MQGNFVSIFLCFTVKLNKSTYDDLNLYLIAKACLWGVAPRLKEIINKTCRILHKYGLLVVSEFKHTNSNIHADSILTDRRTKLTCYRSCFAHLCAQDEGTKELCPKLQCAGSWAIHQREYKNVFVLYEHPFTPPPLPILLLLLQTPPPLSHPPPFTTALFLWSDISSHRNAWKHEMNKHCYSFTSKILNRFPPLFLSRVLGPSQAEWGHVWRWCSSTRSCDFCEAMSEIVKLLRTWLRVLLNLRDFIFFYKLILQFSLACKRIYDRRSRKCLHSNTVQEFWCQHLRQMPYIQIFHLCKVMRSNYKSSTSRPTNLHDRKDSQEMNFKLQIHNKSGRKPYECV